MSTAQQENPSTYRHHHHINETLELFSGSSSSDLSEELCALKLEDDKADSGGSSVDEKIDNPWAAPPPPPPPPPPPTQPSSQPPPASGVPQTTVKDSLQSPSSNPFGSANAGPPIPDPIRSSYRAPWSNHGAPTAAHTLMTPNMPWIEAHEAWLAATKRSRLSAAATAQAMRRARLASLPADPYAWYASRGGASGRRASSPTGFDSVYDSYAAVESDHYLLMKARADSDSRRLRSLEQHLLGGFAAMPPPYEPISRSRFYSDTFADDESLASSSASSLDPGPPGSGGGGGGGVGAHDLVVSPASPPRSRRSVAQLTECFSRKVFVGGLPPDIDEVEIHAAFCRFGALSVDWPHKANSKSYFPPKGYAFLLFREEFSVQKLIASCVQEDEKLFYFVTSPTQRDKQVQIRPWCLADSDFVMDRQQSVEPRKTVFVGGVPRPLRSSDLARIMNERFGNVCYAGIDVDPELKYPKGAGRVSFSSQQSYIAAINARFVQLQLTDIDKRVEIKPYVLDDQMCDECNGLRCGGKFAPFFCGNVMCLQYYCKHCWAAVHSVGGRQNHKPLVKEGTERPRVHHIFRY
ncbi:cytoplasmic polyadenylation element-binding protein 2-like [Oscarella lobularis]|uniref:cytoplasmic polyadenylation element-binding protein 2-like n=1 Tax=Oscarella lobularis TaxID=121494 RepID=UPI0033140014